MVSIVKRCGNQTALVVRASNSRIAGPPPPSGPRDYKVALVTGANTGIGFVTAKELTQQGYYVVMACRNKERAEAAREKIKEALPECRGPEVAIMDLSDLETVRTWARRAQDFGLPLDVVVANAGVMACPERVTAQGYEYQLGVNHLGHFLLICMLAPLLKASQESTGKLSRVVTVSSNAHFLGGLDIDDLNFRSRKYDRWKAYQQSKLCNVLFAYELARRAPCVASNALHPGVVATELGRYLLPEGGLEAVSWWQRPFLEVLRKVALTPEQGARTSIYLASSSEVEGVTGRYFDACQERQSGAQSRDIGTAKRLWDLSAEMVGLDADRDIGSELGKELFP